MLGGHSRFVGLGEMARVLLPGPMGLERTRERLCSCNNKMADCIFWGKIDSQLGRNGELPMEEKYQILLNTFEAVFWRDRIPVDSSKYLGPLQAVHHNREVANVKVLFLLKDVRAFTISHLDSKKRKGHRSLQQVSAYHFLSWYKGNREMRNFLRRESIPHLKIGYEELCLYPKPIVQKICDFLGEKPEPSMLALKESNSHVIRGNRMHRQPDKRQGIFYDYRWFYRREWLLPSMLLPNVMKFNRREVYSNEVGRLWTS
jgi:hypothetical protein